MALTGKRLDELTEITIPLLTDVLYVENKPASDHNHRKITMLNLRGGIFNVMDYAGGATINDGATDASTAIQAALDAANAVGGTVYFPAGTYIISAAIDVANYGKFKGEAGKSIICQTTASTPLFQHVSAANVEQLIFEGLVFDADAAGCVGWYKPGYYTAYTEFRDCQFRLDLSISIQTIPGHFRMYNCIDGKSGTLRTSHQAIDFGDATDVTASFTKLIEGCWFWSSEGVAAAVCDRSGNTLAFESCTWQKCATPAVSAIGIRNTLFMNCNFEDINPGEVDADDCLVTISADSTAVPGNVSFYNCWVQNNGATWSNPWTAWVQLTTSGADAKAWFFGCSGNMGNGYWTSTGSSHTLDLPGNTNVLFCNPVNSNSSFGAAFSIGRAATFYDDVSIAGTVVDGTNTDVVYAVKTIVKSIDVDDDASTDDYSFDDDAANTTKQTITLTGIIPAYATLIDAHVRCHETVTGSASMRIDLGTSSGGTELLTGSPDTTADILASAAGASVVLAPQNTARTLYLSGTPGANWNTLNAGRWVVMLTYIDYGAVKTYKI